MTPAHRKRILMLHGFVQSGEIFSSKTGGLRKRLSKMGYDLFYPTSPLKITVEELMALHNIESEEHSNRKLASTFNTTTGGQDIYCGWWKRNSSSLQDFNIEQNVMNYLHDYVLENGPFEGMIGFSQGGALVGYLSTDFHKLLNLAYKEHPPLKFFITFSGFRLEAPQFQSDYDKQLISMPSLHVQGEQDTVVTEMRMLSLYKSCHENKRAMLKHPGGHYVPNSKQYVNQICRWIESVENQRSSQPDGIGRNTYQNQDTAKPDLEESFLETIDAMIVAAKFRN